MWRERISLLNHQVEFLVFMVTAIVEKVTILVSLLTCCFLKKWEEFKKWNDPLVAISEQYVGRQKVGVGYLRTRSWSVRLFSMGRVSLVNGKWLIGWHAWHGLVFFLSLFFLNNNYPFFIAHWELAHNYSLFLRSARYEYNIINCRFSNESL